MKTDSIDLLELPTAAVERPAPGKAPTAFRIWRAGDNRTDKGRVVLTARSAATLMAAQSARGNIYSIDVDHLSLSDTAPPEARKAVGWHRLAVRDGAGGEELWAVDVSWTPAVKAGLESQPPEWRYFSPAYDVDAETREVTRYLNTAVTNNPATWQVTALAAEPPKTAPSASNEQNMRNQEMMAKLTADVQRLAARRA